MLRKQTIWRRSNWGKNGKISAMRRTSNISPVKRVCVQGSGVESVLSGAKSLGREVGVPWNCLFFNVHGNRQVGDAGPWYQRHCWWLRHYLSARSPGSDQSERATCILYIEIVLLSDLLSAPPHSQPQYSQQKKTLNALSPPLPTDVCVIGGVLAFNTTQIGRTARKGSLRCLDK